MTTKELPCRWRGDGEQHFPCNSPKLFAPNGVTLENCTVCYCRDHEPLTEAELKSLEGAEHPPNYNACIHRGETITEHRDGHERAVTVENECPSCQGKKMERLVVFRCDKLEKDVTINACRAPCPHFQEKQLDTPNTTS